MSIFTFWRKWLPSNSKPPEPKKAAPKPPVEQFRAIRSLPLQPKSEIIANRLSEAEENVFFISRKRVRDSLERIRGLEAEIARHKDVLREDYKLSGAERALLYQMKVEPVYGDDGLDPSKARVTYGPEAKRLLFSTSRFQNGVTRVANLLGTIKKNKARKEYFEAQLAIKGGKKQVYTKKFSRQQVSKLEEMLAKHRGMLQNEYGITAPELEMLEMVKVEPIGAGQLANATKARIYIKPKLADQLLNTTRFRNDAVGIMRRVAKIKIAQQKMAREQELLEKHKRRQARELEQMRERRTGAA